MQQNHHISFDLLTNSTLLGCSGDNSVDPRTIYIHVLGDTIYIGRLTGKASLLPLLQLDSAMFFGL